MKEKIPLTWKSFAGYLLLYAFIGISAAVYVEIVKRAPHLVFGCAMKQVFHLYCPGCGGTRAVNSLLHFDIVRSFLYNPLILYMAGVAAFYFFKAIYLLIKDKGNTILSLDLRVLWAFLWIMLGFFVLRNILLVFFGIDYMGELAKFWNT